MLPFQLNGLVDEPCIASLAESRTITGYKAYVRIYDHYSAKTNKPRNFITTINQNGPQKQTGKK